MSRCPTAFRLCVLVVVAMALSACDHINHLREAQRAFDEAAAADNGARLGRGPSAAALQAPVGVAVSQTSGYAAVVQGLNLMSDTEIAKLREDRLLTNALMLKAYAYWRLGEHDKALAIKSGPFAEELKGIPAAQQPQRDVALMEALPGFLINTEELRALPERPGYDLARYCQARKRFADATRKVEDAKANLPDGHELRAYLHASTLMIFSNHRQMRSTYEVAGVDPFEKGQCEMARDTLQRLLDIYYPPGGAAPPAGIDGMLNNLKAITGLREDAVEPGKRRLVAACEKGQDKSICP